MPLFTRVRSWYQKAAAPNSDLSSILDTIQEEVSESGFADMPSYTVCIVEDSAECAAAPIDKVAASPFSEGVEVHEMASRAELEYFVSEGRAIDILITDINLGNRRRRRHLHGARPVPDGLENPGHLRNWLY